LYSDIAKRLKQTNMPKIYEYFGLIFLIHTDDHNPINIHVRYGRHESIIEIFTTPSMKVTEVKKRKGISGKELPPKELNTALKFVNAKAEEFVNKWTQIRDNKYTGSPIRLTRKIV
jgi:hypothetical protein